MCFFKSEDHSGSPMFLMIHICLVNTVPSSLQRVCH
uniref:Uncharacterized protein n=1 Tax=Arundo donax TaxID=35708 RepID=A0A0A9ECH7_ARUDO